jgi:hypothetical protein
MAKRSDNESDNLESIFSPQSQEKSEKKNKKIGGKKRSRIEAGVLINPYEEKPKCAMPSQIIPKDKATIFSQPKFINEKKASNASNTIYSTLNSATSAQSKSRS